ncbi:MAG: glycosyltransferase [Alphaproteobacteria bacterium]|nr:glycosyltransferase [Alphaproteobacteria bacterium]MCW5738726.1 glycosyltransferase [Alphaproteobacteria bacterium]
MTATGLSVTIAAILWCVATGWHVATHLLALVRHRRPAGELPPASSFTIVAPMVGDGDASAAYVAALVDLAKAGAEVLICVEEYDDPAAERVTLHWTYLTGEPPPLLVGRATVSFNPKVNNIAKGLETASRPLIIVMDSGSLLRVDELRAMGAMINERTGLVQGLKPPRGARNWAAEAECTMLNGYTARMIFALDKLGIQAACGGILLFSRAAFERIGGVDALSREIAEDFSLLAAVRDAGLRTTVADVVPAYPRPYRRWSDIWGRQVRWARLRWLMVPVTVILEPLLSGTVSMVAALIAGPAFLPAWLDWLSVGGIAAIVVLHWGIWIGAELLFLSGRGLHRSWRQIPCIMLRETLMLPIAIHALSGRDIKWRDVDVVGGWREQRARAASSGGAAA